MVGAIFGYVIGGLGLAVAVVRELAARADRRRLRPVVIAHELQGRHLVGDAARRVFAFTVHLTNESATTAFNIRFGVELSGTPIAWRHSREDPEASRVNVLAGGERHPAQGYVDVEIPDLAILGGDGDPDPERTYWALYESPAGDWWLTRNPAARHGDLIVERLRDPHGWLDQAERRAAELERRGAEVERDIVAELQAGAAGEPAGEEPP